VESLSVLYSKARVLALPTNIRQGWKWIEVANTQAYYDTATITAVKSFIVQAPESHSLIDLNVKVAFARSKISYFF
jgi:hypothetical protein